MKIPEARQFWIYPYHKVIQAHKADESTFPKSTLAGLTKETEVHVIEYSAIQELSAQVEEMRRRLSDCELALEFADGANQRITGSNWILKARDLARIREISQEAINDVNKYRAKYPVGGGK